MSACDLHSSYSTNFSADIQKAGLMKSLIAGLVMTVVSLCGTFCLAQEQRRYPVGPQTKWAVGATPKPADELKKQLDSGSTVLIVDVRQPASFEKKLYPAQSTFPSLSLKVI
jgi:hypothetical protein